MATKAVDATQLDNDLTSVANAIRQKGGGSQASITPTSDTWQHNQWVTLTMDVDEEGNLSIRQSSGSGSTTGLHICYPQGSSTTVTKIPDIPTTPGTYEFPFTAVWNGDQNDHTLTYTVVLGTSAALSFPAGFVSAVQAIPTGITPVGTKNITANGTYDVTNFASAAVNVPGGGGGIPLPSAITAGDTPVVINASGVAGSSSSYNSLKATGLKITIPKNGNYRIKWCTSNAITSSSGTPPSCQSRLYKNGSAIGTAVTVNAGRETVSTYNDDFNAGDVIEVWLKNAHQNLGIATLYHGGVSNLMACIDWDISGLWE